MHFGSFLKRFRQQRQLTLRELSKLAGFDHGYLCRLETGQKTNPTVFAMDVIARTLKMTPRDKRIWQVLLHHPAPDELVEYVLLKPSAYNVEDFQTLAALCPVGLTRQPYEVWMDLLHQAQALRLQVMTLQQARQQVNGDEEESHAQDDTEMESSLSAVQVPVQGDRPDLGI